MDWIDVLQFRSDNRCTAFYLELEGIFRNSLPYPLAFFLFFLLFFSSNALKNIEFRGLDSWFWCNYNSQAELYVRSAAAAHRLLNHDWESGKPKNYFQKYGERTSLIKTGEIFIKPTSSCGIWFEWFFKEKMRIKKSSDF